MAVFTFDTDVANLAYPYAFIRPKGLTTIWNGTAFVTYSAGSWNSYRVAATESLPGVYDVAVPSALPTGYYDLFLYEGVGATALISDVRIASGTEYYTTDAEAPEMPNYGGVWVMASPEVADDTTGTNAKKYMTVDSEAVLAFDYSRFREIRLGGETVTATSIVPPANVSVEDQGVSGAFAYGTFTASAAGTYTIEVSTTFSGGAVYNSTRQLVVTA